MNKLNVQQTGGFPLETDTLDFMQTAYDLLNKLGYIAGNATIISGCVKTGDNVSDGVVFYGGEVYEFRGGAIQSQVRIFGENISREFENGSVKTVYQKRWMGFGSSGGNIQWSSFTRPKSTRQLTDDLANITVIPVGMISMWAGTINTIPAKWELCDGTNGTPDLRSKFVVGYNPAESDYNAVGKTGGAKTVTLTENQMPAHNHNGSVYIAPHDHNLPSPVVSIGGSASNALSNHNNVAHKTVNKTNVAGGGTHTLSIQSKGGGQAHENRPPYYTIAFIQFKG